MNILSLSISNIVNSVWTAVTRTLTADPFTDAVGGVTVWGHASRSLTALAGTNMSLGFAGAQTLAASTVLNIIGGGVHAWHYTLGIVVPGAVTGQFGSYDGTTFTATQTVSAGTSITQELGWQGSAGGFTLKNAGGGNITYSASWLEII